MNSRNTQFALATALFAFLAYLAMQGKLTTFLSFASVNKVPYTTDDQNEKFDTMIKNRVNPFIGGGR